MARMRRIRWLLVPAALLGLAAAALAAHGGARTKATSIDSFTSGAVTARCPAGRGLGLGGFQSNAGADVGLVVSRDEPASGHAWAADATNTFINPGRLSATAYCGPRRHLRRVSATTSIAAQSGGTYPSGSAVARCPHRTSVRLGGFSADVSPQPDGPGLNLHAMSLASPRKWKVTATNEGPAPGTLRATAWCGHGRALSRAVGKASVPDGGSAAATARCRHGKKVALGGFQTGPSGSLGPYLNQLRRPAAARWRAGAVQLSGNGGGSLRAIAYCG
jgi:hypothetical protein